jgi:hypothetical protein
MDERPVTCPDCAAQLEHCHATSVEHADGVTECLADEPCQLPHHLHRWPVACADLPAPCSCREAPGGMADAA